MIARALTAACALAALAGCVSQGRDLGFDRSGDGVKTLVPAKSVNIAPSLQVPLEALVAGAIVYWYTDPLGATWRVEETRYAGDRVRIAVRRKPVASGGEGEAEAVFRRRAEALSGGRGYTVIEFSEGIEAGFPFAQRVASGVVQLKRD
jgi:hypothetical protein